MGRQVRHVHEPGLRPLRAQVLDHPVGEEADRSVLGWKGHRGGADGLARSTIVVLRREQQGGVLRHLVAAPREVTPPRPVVVVHRHYRGHAGQYAAAGAQDVPVVGGFVKAQLFGEQPS